MTLEILVQVFLFGIALSMDAFAASIIQGLTCIDIDKKKRIFTASVFGVMQGLMPLIGFFIVEIITIIVGETLGEKVGNIVSSIVTYIAFFLLIFLGSKMIYEGCKEIHKEQKEKTPKKFLVKEILYLGVATSIDALGTGVAFHSGISTSSTIWIHVLIIAITTFIISMIGLFLGNKIEKLFKGKYEITSIIGGVILILLGIWILLSHLIGA